MTRVPRTNRRVYGPVPSRRFGLSLGVDLVPFKICPYDCVYCQVGRTTRRTLQRSDFYPPDAVLADLDEALRSGPRPDVITLAGSGDPSLYASLGTLIDSLRQRSGLPVVLLTNGALLWRPEVLADALRADVLAPSLDAGDPETFAAINRPHRGISFDRMLGGLRDAIARHPGQVRLEVMLVEGLNDDDAAVERIASRVADLELTSLDVNTPVRPAPDRRVHACSPQRLAAACGLLGPRARVVASPGGQRSARATGVDAESAVLEYLARRPATAEDLVNALGFDADELAGLLERMTKSGQARSRSTGSAVWYHAAAGVQDR